MTKLSNSMSAKEIVAHFYSKLGKKNDGNFGRHMVTAYKLLESYSPEEIIIATDKCFANEPEEGIYSLAFISYNIKDIITPIRKQKLSEKVKEAESKNTNFGSLPKPSDNSSKLKRFGNRKEFNWDG